MSKYVVPIITGFVVALVVSLGLGALMAAAGERSNTPMIAGVLLGAFTAYIMANLAGNRKVATADQAAKTEALQFTPPPGKGAVYLFREGFIGKAAGLNVAVDGKEVAQLKSPRFTRVIVSPGDHTVMAGFGGLAGAQNKATPSGFTVAAGQVAAFRFSIAMGALVNTVAVTPMPDLADVKQRLTKMPMTVPDVAEV
jgi:hypothetical protein